MNDRCVNEWRVGRNFIRVGDVVKVLPSRPRKRDGFLARVTKIVERDGEVAEVEVVGERGFRMFRPERIERVSQTRHEDKRRPASG